MAIRREEGAENNFLRFEFERAQNPQRIAPKTVEPPAQEIVRVEELLEQLAEQKNPVYLLHFPRGATPIVRGIYYAWKKKHGKTKPPFNTILVPLSRENMAGPNASRIIEDRIRNIENNAVLVYVDEAVTSQNSYANIVDIRKALKRLKKNNAGLFANIFLNSNGRFLDPGTWRKLRQMARYKNLKLRIHYMPEKLPWTDHTPMLGRNWGLRHRLPLDLIAGALVGTENWKIFRQPTRKRTKRFSQEEYDHLVQAQSDTVELMKAFEENYKFLVSHPHFMAGNEEKPPLFRSLQYGTQDYKYHYGMREHAAIDALRLALYQSGFGKKYGAEIKGRQLKLQNASIAIPRLRDHLRDTHPSHEAARGRTEYLHHLNSDPYTLIDFSQTKKRLARAIGRPNPAQKLQGALFAAIGSEIHRRRHPSAHNRK